MIAPRTEEPGRNDDETAGRVLMLASAGYGIGDICADTELDAVEVIELLHAHRDCFDRLNCCYLT